MSDLESIAGEKAEAALEKRLSGLATDIKAIQRELSARGLLRSGAMLKRVLTACSSTLESHADEIIAQYEWAIAQALLVSHSWVDKLSNKASLSLEKMRAPVKAHLEQACRIADQPKLLDRLYGQYELAESAAKSKITLSLRARFAERRRGLVRRLPGAITQLISKLFRGGA